MSVSKRSVSEKEKTSGLKVPKKLTLSGALGLAASVFTGLWAVLMLTVFPLYVKNQYEKIGACKFDFFLKVSLCTLIPAFICGCWKLYFEKSKGAGKKWSIMDWCMLFYLAAAGLSYLCSDYKAKAWPGTDSWAIGLRSQILFVLIYFVVSRYFSWYKLAAAGLYIGSGTAFLMGILHRFMIDPLGMYEGIDSYYYILFLSTIGQATWFSSFVCTVFSVGLCIYMFCQKRSSRIFWGIYCVLGFMTIVTQNSDSAFIALLCMLLVLFVAACKDNDKMERFLELLFLMFASFKIIGILQTAFAERALELGSISMFLSKGWLTWVLFLLVCVLYFVFLSWREKHPEEKKVPFEKILVRGSVGISAGAVIALALLIFLNTKGVFLKLFGFQSTNNYLLFNDAWGSSRGLNWSVALDAFTELSFLHKFTGAGPDCFASFCYEVPAIQERLYAYWGKSMTLSNAHNEFLNTLVCLGILGFAAFAAIFIAGIRRYFKGQEKTAYALVGAVVLLSYAGHNFFCYQQVCCTPFLFFLLGAAENLLRRKQLEE